MKKVCIAVLLILIVINNVMCQSKTHSTNNISNLEVVDIQLTHRGPFNYFQLNIESGIGVKGKVLLNNKNLVTFSGNENLLCANIIHDFKNGENKINLYIESTTYNANLAEYIDGSLVVITLYAMNEQDFPDEKNRVFIIKWNNKNYSNNMQYNFDIQLKK